MKIINVYQEQQLITFTNYLGHALNGLLQPCRYDFFVQILRLYYKSIIIGIRKMDLFLSSQKVTFTNSTSTLVENLIINNGGLVCLEFTSTAKRRASHMSQIVKQISMQKFSFEMIIMMIHTLIVGSHPFLFPLSLCISIVVQLV